MAQPLPAGWEARYDAGSGRYYFINHYNKQTTWVDPRGAVQPQQPQRAAYPQQQQASYPQQQQASYAQQQQQEAQRRQQQEAQQRQQEAERHRQQQAERQRQQEAERQRQEEAERERQRENEHQQESMRMQNISSSSSGGYGSLQETSFDTGGDDDLVSAAEKRAMTEKLKNTLDLEGVNDDLIMMTLQGVQYNAEMAIQVFESMGFKKKGASGGAGSSSTDRWESTTTRPKKQDKGKGKGKTKAKKETASSQPIPSLPEISSQPIPSLPTTDMSTGPEISFSDLDMKFKSDAGSDLFSKLTPQETSNVLSKMSETAGVSVNSMFANSSSTSSSVTSHTATHKQKGKLEVVGATQGMARGPDPSLLRNSRMPTKGADTKLARGAQTSLAKGQSNMAKGQNRGLALGANRSLRAGSNSALLVGPSSERSV